MDWQVLFLSFKLALFTLLILLPVGIIFSRLIAYNRFPGRRLILSLIVLPLVLPPTVLGFYLLEAFSEQALIGSWYYQLTGHSLIFTFEGLVAASLLFNLPFAVIPMQRAFSNIPSDIREAAWCCGLSQLKTFLKVELPLAWPGIIAALVLVFAHTLGEFGVLLMVGGNIPGETRTAAIAIYDYLQLLNDTAAGKLSALLLLLAFVSIVFIGLLNPRMKYDEQQHFI